MMYYFCPRMAEAGGGRVVNISSGAALAPAFGRANYTATKLALEGMSQALAHDLSSRVAVNVLRLELSVWSEGYAATLGEAADRMPFEHPAIMSDAVLWMAQQPLDHTGKIHTIGELRERGVVRPVMLYRDHKEAS